MVIKSNKLNAMLIFACLVFKAIKILFIIYFILSVYVLVLQMVSKTIYNLFFNTWDGYLNYKVL